MRAIRATRLWLERVVIGLSLCPWARPPYERGGVRIATTEASTPEDLSVALFREIALLQHEAETPPETSILVCPQAFPEDFVAFAEFVADAEELIRLKDLDDEYQLVAFHPQFRFADEDADDASNFVNRSPYPALHILTQQSVTQAVDLQSELAESTPTTNQALLRKLGAEHMRRRVDATIADAA